jgi:hypothetical protein
VKGKLVLSGLSQCVVGFWLAREQSGSLLGSDSAAAFLVFSQEQERQ